nr:T9SS type A sorting domain-containing protein [Saprospiraceae bacterium]
MELSAGNSGPCTNSYHSDPVITWKGIYKKYLSFLHTGEVDSADYSTLRQHSSLCSDLYGKPVHLARAITATFDTTYYDNNDDCIHGIEQRIVRITPQEEHKIEVYPNPTDGLLQIALPDNYSGELTVINLSGKILSTYTIEDRENYILQMPNQSGMYILRFESTDGKSEHHRIMVID